MNPWIRSVAAVAISTLTLGATHSSGEQAAEHVAMKRAHTFFVNLTHAGEPVPSNIRRMQISFAAPTFGARTAKFARNKPTVINSASTVYKVTDLSASVPGFYPTALNNDGRIVGIAMGSDGGSNSYFINNGGSSGTLFDQYAKPCLGPGLDVSCFATPTAISNKSGLVAGTYISVANYNGTLSEGWIIWKLTSTSSTISFLTNNPNGPEVTISSISDQNIAVGGSSYFPLTGPTFGQDVQFPIFKCTLSNFDAMSINDSGLIVGSSNGRAAAMTLGGCPAYVPNVGPGASIADVVADDGDMLIQTAQTSVVWSKGHVFEIPLPSGYDPSMYQVDALSLSDTGKVVGDIVQKSNTSSPVAGFEYSAGHSVDVTSLFPVGSGWTASVATGINDHDEIVGYGTYGSANGGFALHY